jgi:1,4-alpha-glucan branching enzyme
MLKKTYSKTKPVCKVTFSLPLEAAEGAEKVFLLGDFNAWDVQNGIEMKRGKANFEAGLELEVGKSYEFRYLIDGKQWENDWDADAYAPSPFAGITNSVLVLTSEANKPESDLTPAAKPARAAAKKAKAS